MDTNHGAFGDPSDDDDIFGPIEDGEEVFEWIDDQADEDASADRAKQPAPTFRERLAAVRSGGSRLRRSRREVGAAVAVVVLACALGGAGTAWFDGVAGAADRAAVVSLAVDSVVDGDPATASYNAANTSAVGQYVVELSNNSPDAVTLDSVAIDAGALVMSSTGWKPLGTSPRIPAGGTAKVVLTVKVFCPTIVLNQQTGMFSAAGGTGGGALLAFPALHVQARDADGDQRDLVLPTRVTVSSQLSAANSGLLTFQRPGLGGVPQIVTADAGLCSQYTADRTAHLAEAGGGARFPSEVDFTYTKVLSPAATGTFTLGFTVKNTTDHAENLTTRTDVAYLDDNQLRTSWTPQLIKLEPGASTQAQLRIDIHDCTSVLAGAPVLGETMLEVDDLSGGPPRPVFIDQALSGSLRLAGDIVQQEKAACS